MVTLARDITITLQGNAKPFLNAMNKGKTAARSFARSADRSLSRLSSKAKRAGAQMTQHLGAALVRSTLILGGMGIAAVKMAADFEKGMATVATLLDDSDKHMGKFKKGVLDLSVASGQSTQTLTKGLFDIISAGIKAEEAMGFLKVATEAALGGSTTTAIAVDALTSIVNAYGKQLGETKSQTERAKVASDIFFSTIKFGKTTFAELAPVIGRLTSISASINLSFSSMGAALAALTKKGIGTAAAVTGVRSSLVSIIKPTTSASKFAKELGIDFTAAGLKSKGFVKFIQEIAEKTKGSTESLAKLFPNIRALAAITALTTKEGLAELIRIEKANDKATGETKKAADKIRNTLSFMIGQLTAKVKKFAIEFGTGIIGPFKDFLKLLDLTADSSDDVFSAMEIGKEVAITLGKAFFFVQGAGLEMLGTVSDIVDFFEDFDKITNILVAGLKKAFFELKAFFRDIFESVFMASTKIMEKTLKLLSTGFGAIPTEKAKITSQDLAREAASLRLGRIARASKLRRDRKEERARLDKQLDVSVGQDVSGFKGTKGRKAGAAGDIFRGKAKTAFRRGDLFGDENALRDLKSTEKNFKNLLNARIKAIDIPRAAPGEGLSPKRQKDLRDEITKTLLQTLKDFGLTSKAKLEKEKKELQRLFSTEDIKKGRTKEVISENIRKTIFSKILNRVADIKTPALIKPGGKFTPAQQKEFDTKVKKIVKEETAGSSLALAELKKISDRLQKILLSGEKARLEQAAQKAAKPTRTQTVVTAGKIEDKQPFARKPGEDFKS